MDQRRVPHRPLVFRKGWAEGMLREAADKYFKYDVRDPKEFWRIAEYYDFKQQWNEWYESNKDSATKMECTMCMLHMKARNANKGRGMDALDASPIEGMHRAHSQVMARCGTYVDWTSGTYKRAGKLRYQHFNASGCMDPVDETNKSSIPTIEEAIEMHVYNSECKQITVTMHYMNVPCEEVATTTLLHACRTRSMEESKSKGQSVTPQPLSLCYSKIASLVRSKTEADIMSPVPIHNTSAFENATWLELNKKKMRTQFLASNSDIPKALKVPKILTTDISLAFYADPLNTTKFNAYVKQFSKAVTYRNKSFLCEPPWVFSSHDLVTYPQGFLNPEQTNLTILIPICLACAFNNGCPDEKPPSESPHFMEICKLLVWSAAIITNEDRNRIRTHAVIQHYTRLSNHSCYLSSLGYIGGVYMISELFNSCFHRRRVAEEPFTIAPGFEDELKTQSLTYNVIKSQMDLVLADCREIFGRGHLDRSHESQNDRFQNFGEYIIC